VAARAYRKSKPVAASGVSAAAAGAVLSIDLGAIRENHRILSRKLKGAICAGVVKADAYGLGSAQVARALQEEGCRTFFVAHVGEAIALREAIGADAAIFVLNGLPPGSEGEARAAGVTPVLNSLAQIAAWRTEAASAGVRLPAAVQVDSGMSRLGMPPAEVRQLADDLGLLAGLDVVLVMSHLACADEPTHPANAEQLARFRTLRKLLPTAPASLANSSGIFLGRGFHFDMARPGAALYGINPVPDEKNPMRPVVGLHAKVVQTRYLSAGEGVGYGYAAHTTRPTRTATISLGYADGWQRHAAAQAWFGDVALPFIGRVSMDSIILDVSALHEGALLPGAMVELIGQHQNVDEVAMLARTIGYEVLTSLGYRFHRIYKDDGT